MRRTQFKILYVGRGRAVPGDLAEILGSAGYVIPRAKRASAHGIETNAFRAIVSDGITAEELRDLLQPRRAGLRRSSPAMFTAEFAPFERPSGRAPGTVAGQQTRRAIPMTLRALRESVGRTQGQIARRVSMTQPQLSRVEARRDHLISTLRKYVRALGGRIEVAAVVKGARIVLKDV